MDGDNPLSGIIGMVIMISVLPMILQMLSGLTGGGQQQGPIGGPAPHPGQNPFQVAQPVVGPGNYLLVPGNTYSYGNFKTPINLGAPVAPATIQDMYSGLTGGGRGWFGR